MAAAVIYLRRLSDISWQWFVDHAHRRHALWWLALIAFVDAIISPLAPEVFLVALMLAQPTKWKQYLATAITASVAGAMGGYFVAVFLFNQFGEPLLAFYHLESAFNTAQHMMVGHVFVTMAVASFTPIPDKVFIYAGGFLGVHFLPFVMGYLLGRGARMAIIVYLTGRYGKRALELFSKYVLWFVALIFVLVLGYVIVHLHLFGL